MNKIFCQSRSSRSFQIKLVNTAKEKKDSASFHVCLIRVWMKSIKVIIAKGTELYYYTLLVFRSGE